MLQELSVCESLESMLRLFARQETDMHKSTHSATPSPAPRLLVTNSTLYHKFIDREPQMVVHESWSKVMPTIEHGTDPDQGHLPPVGIFQLFNLMLTQSSARCTGGRSVSRFLTGMLENPS